MKRISIMICAVLTLGLMWSFAVGEGGKAPSKLQEDYAGRPIQGIAPHPDKDVKLTGASQVIDVSADTAWVCYSPTGGIFRVMTSATKAGMAHTLPSGTWHGDVVNHKKYPDGRAFLNISGAQDSGTEKATCRRQ